MADDIARLGIEMDSTQVRRARGDLDDFAAAGKRAETATESMMASVKRLGAMFAGAFTVNAIIESIKDITLLASRYNELGVVMETVGRNQGVMRSQLDNLETALRKTGISALESRNAIAKMMQANLDLAKATDLARLAQDAAVIAGTNSSEAFMRLIYGIQSGQTEILRTVGINVNFENSYKKLAAQLGKTTDSLTESEKSTARLNAVMASAPQIAGAYEAAMTNTGKILRSTQRYAEDLKVALGQAFQGAFALAVDAYASALQGAQVSAKDLADALLGAVAAGSAFAALTGIPLLLGKIAAGIKLITAAMLANPFLAAAAAISTVVGLLVTYRDAMVTIGDTTATVTDFIASAWSVAKDAVASAAEAMEQRFGVAGEVIAAVITRLPDIFSAGFTAIGQGGAVLVNRLIGHFVGLHDAAAVVATGLRDAFVTAFVNIQNLAAGLGKGIAAVFKGDFGFTALKEALGNLSSQIGPTVAEQARQSYIKGFNGQYVQQAVGVIVKASEAIEAGADARLKARAHRDMLNVYGDPAVAVNGNKAIAASTKDLSKELAKQADLYRQLMGAIGQKMAQDAQELMQGEKLTEGQNLALRIQQQLAEGKVKLSPVQKEAIQNTLDEMLALEQANKARRDAIELEKEQAKMSADMLAAGDKTVDSLRAQIQQQLMHGQEIGKTRIEIARLNQARTDLQATEEESMATRMQEVAMLGQAGELSQAYAAYAERLREIARLRRESAGIAVNNAMAEESAAAAEESVRQWKEGAARIEQSITDALMRGFESGKDFARNLIDTLKNWFKSLILRPIIQPIAAGIAGAFGGFGLGGGGESISSMLSMGGGGSSGVGGLVSAGKSLWQGFSTGFNSVGASLGQSVAKLGQYINSPYLTNMGVGMQGVTGSAAGVGVGNILGSVANVGTGVGIGIAGGRLISGGYSLNGGSGNSTVNAGTAVGAVVGSIVPVIGTAVGAAVGGVLGGVLNRAFGRGPKEVTATGIEGTFGPDGFSGNSFADWKRKGGWFRSDKKGTDRAAIDPQLDQMLDDGYAQIRKTFTDIADTLGLSAQAMQGTSAQVRVAFGQDAAANEKAITDMLGKVSDEMAQKLMPNIGAFAKAGETAGQTFARVGLMYAGVEDVLTTLGKTSQQAFGAVGLASIGARQQLVDLAGGLEALTTGTAYFAQNFMTSREQLAAASANLKQDMARLGIGFIQTKEQFKDVAMSLDLSSAGGAQLFGAMMQIAPAFNDVTTAMEQADREARQFADAMDRIGKPMMAATTTMQNAAGGADALAAGMDTFFTAFHSAGDQANALARQMQREFANLGMPMPATRENFKALVDAIDVTSASGQALFGKMMSLAGGMDAAISAAEQLRAENARMTEQLTQAVQAAADNVAAAEQRLADTRLRIQQAYAAIAQRREEEAQRRADARRRAAIEAEAEQRDAALRALQDAYQAMMDRQRDMENRVANARNALTDAYQREADALRTTIDRFADFTRTLREFRDGLLTSDLSPLSPLEQYQQSRTQALDTVARAKSGDETAMGQVTQRLQEFLEASRTVNASGDQFQRDFALVQTLLDQLETSSANQQSAAEQQLEALNAQVQGLIEIRDQVITVAEGIAALQAAQGDLAAAQRDADEALAAVNRQQASNDAWQTRIKMEDLAREEARRQAEFAAWEQDQFAAIADLQRQAVADQRNLAAAQRAHAQAIADLEAHQRAALAAEQANLLLSSNQGTWTAAQAAQAVNDGIAYQTARQEAFGNEHSQLLLRIAQQQQQVVDAANAAAANAAAANAAATAAAAKPSGTQVPGYLLPPGSHQRFVAGDAFDPYAMYTVSPAEYAAYSGSGARYFANGNPYVAEDGPAYLHQGEAVLTKEENRTLRQLDFSRYGKEDTKILCDEIKALRAEVAKLREDAAQQTGAMIAAQFDASRRNADQIAEATQEAASQASWRDKSQARLA